MLSLDPLRRFCLRFNFSLVHGPSSEVDSEYSSPERNCHVSNLRFTSVNDVTDSNGTISHGTPDLSNWHPPISLATPSALAVSHRLQSPSDHKSLVTRAPALQPSVKSSSFIRRVTSKLNLAIPLRSAPDALRSRPSTRTLAPDMNNSHPVSIPVSSSLPNVFGSKKHREAALRERGLRPPCKDLSQQEREADGQISPSPSPVSLSFEGSTEAEQFKASWLAANRTSESSESDCGPHLPPYLQVTQSGPQPDTDLSRDLPCPARPSLSSSFAPLSSCYLEVLHEDPSEQGPITPPPAQSPLRPPIIITGPLDYPSSSILIVESPVSCNFSSHCPGSTLESQSQSDHFPVREKENHKRSRPPRRHASDACEQPLKAAGRIRMLSKLGTRSLSNLRRRSITEFSLGQASRSTFSSADLSIPRTAVSPTMHSLGSIIRETRVIQDAESRRLSELAFLD